MKYSNTAITQLTRLYKSILVKCAIFNAAILMSSAFVATPAMADHTVITDNATLSGTYQGSTANDDGGVFFVDAEGKTVEINSSKFTGNRVTGNNATGGAISLKRGTLNIDDTVFTENKAPYSGAIFTYSGGNKLKITNSQFNSNEALGAGALQAMFETEIKDTSFTGNKATGDSSGAGALFVGAVGKTKLDNVTFANNTSATRGGAISTRAADLADNSEAKIDILGSTFTGNTAGTTGGAIDNYMYSSVEDATAVYIDGTTFTNNTANKGGAIYNHGQTDKAGKTASLKIVDSTFTGNGVDATSGDVVAQYGGAIYNEAHASMSIEGTFTGNKAVRGGGAIYNESELIVAANTADVMFSGNTANGAANDIYNAGTLTLNAASGKTISLEGGIDGDSANKGTVNVAGDVEVSTIKNQTVAHNSGELHITNGAADGSNLSGSTVTVVNGAVINTIDNVINDYSESINLADGAKVKGDVDFEKGVADKYAATSGTIKYMVANLIGAAANGTKTIQVAGNGSTINISEAKFNAENGLTFESSGAADGKMIVNGMSGGIEDAADASSNVETVDYDFKADESVDNNKEFHHTVTVNGNGTSVLTLNADLGTAAGANTTYNKMNFAGAGALNNAGMLHINDSNVGVDVNNYGTLVSDPTTYTGKVTNAAGALASFDADIFTTTAELANNGDAYLENDVKFQGNAKITGNGDLYLMSGTTAFNNTANTNDAYLASGAKFSGTLIGGSLDTQNGAIDTGLGTIQNADLYMDAKLSGTGSADAFTATTGSTIKEITILGNDYNPTKDELKIAVGNATLDDDVVINGANYYTKVEKDAAGNLVFSDKLINTSTIRGTGDGSSTFIGDVVIGDKAATTTLGTAKAQVALSDSTQTVAVTAADGMTLNGNAVLTTDSALNGAKLTPGTVAKTALASGVQTTLTNADTLYTNLGGVTATAAEINQLHESGVEKADLTKLHNVTASADDLNKLTGNAVTAADFTKLHNVEATAFEINQLHESGVVTADLTKLHNVTASADDLNKLTGNAVTAADFTKLHGITADANELNVLDGITASTQELNQLTGSGVVTADLTKLHAVTATAADLNKLTGNEVTAADFTKLHGISADAAELNVLDGITASTEELNYMDGVTSNVQTQLNAKVANEGNFTADTNSALIKDKTVVAAIQDVAGAVDTNTTNIGTLNTWKTNLATANGAANAVHASNIAQTADYRFVTDTQIGTWNAKQDTLTAGNGIDITSNKVSVVANTDGTIVVDTNGVKVGTIQTDNIANKAVTTAKIADGAVMLAKLGQGVQNNLLLNTDTSAGLTVTEGSKNQKAKIALNLASTGGLEEDATNGLQIKAGGVQLAMINGAAMTSAAVDTGSTGTKLVNETSLGATRGAIETKLAAGASGYDIDAKTLKVAGKNVLSEADVAPDYAGTTKAEADAYVLANANKFTNIGSTAGVINTIFNAKQDWISDEFGYDTDTTDANTLLTAAGYADQNGDDNVGFYDALAQLNGADTLAGSVKNNIKTLAASANYDKTTSGLTATTIQGAIDEIDGNVDDVSAIVGDAQTTAATTGQFKDKKIGADINLVNAVDELGRNMVSLGANNVFTGENTFKNTDGIHLQNNVGGNDTNLQATANGLTVDRNVEATGFKIKDQDPVVTSIDVDGLGVTSASAAEKIMATAATVYNGAEKGLYDGTKVKGDTTSTTIKQALTATNGALNNILIADGSKVDSAKIDVLWNASSNTLSGVLGNGVYTGATHVSTGDDLTTAVVSLDTALGADLTTVQTRTTGGLSTTNSANENISALDAAIGGDVTSTNYVAAANSVNANISALDTQVKQNAGDISDIKTEIGTYGTIVTKDAAPAFTGSTLADVNAYVAANGANVADVNTTAGVITAVLADKEAWIGDQLGFNPKTTDANTVLGGEGFTDQDGDGKVSFNDAVVQLKADGVIGTASVSSAGYAATATVKDAVVAIDAALKVDEGNIATNTANIGTLSSLTTDAKGNLVAAINEVDAHADAVQTEVDNIETALGVVNADGTYKASALNNNMFESGGTAASSLDAALLNLATNTTSMTGASIDDSGNLKVNYTSNNYVVDDTNLVASVSALDGALGAKVTGTNGNVLNTNSVNANLDKIDVNMGNLASLATTSSSGKASLVGAVNEVVSDITVAAGTYNVIHAGANVAQNLIDLDTVVGGADAKITSIGDSIGGTWSGNTFTHSNYNSAQNNILNTDNLTTAIGKLDTVIGDADSIVVAGYTGTEVVGAINKLNTNMTDGSLDAKFKSVTIDKAYAITGTTTGELDMGGNALKNVKGLELKDSTGTKSVALTVDGTTNDLVVNQGLKAASLESLGDLTVAGDATITGNLQGSTATFSGAVNVGSLEIGGTGYGITSTGAAKMGTVEAVNGLTVGSANALTSSVAGQLDMGANNLVNIASITTTGNATVGGDLGVTGTSNLHDTNVQGNLTLKNAADPTKTVAMDVRRITVGSDNNDVVQVNGGMLSTDVIASTNGFKVLNSTSADKYTEVFDIDDHGSITSDVFSTDNTAAGNTVTIGKADNSTATTVKGTLEVTGATTLDSTLTADGESKFGKDTSGVYSLDVTDSAVTANKVVEAKSGVKFGTDTTAMTGVSRANLSSVVDHTTNDSVIASAAAVQETRKDIEDKAHAVLGDVYKIDSTTRAVSYDNAALVATTPNGFETGATDLTDALTKYADNVMAAMGTTYAANGTYTNGFAKPAAVDYDGLATDQSLVSAISQLDKNIGTAITGTDRSGTAFDTSATKTVNENIAALDAAIGADVTKEYNGVVKTNSINQNIDAISTTLGRMDNLSTAAQTAGNAVVTRGNLTNANNTPLDKALTVADALSNIDQTLGRIHGLYDGTKVNVTDASYPSVTGANSNLAKGTTVENHLVSLDNAIGSRNIASLNADINKAVNGDATAATGTEARNGSLALGLKSVGDQMGDMNFTSTHYVAAGDNLSGAVRTLDSNLYRVEEDLRDLRRDFNNGMASMSAMSALVPNPRAAGNTSLSVGTGAYNGRTAVAVGGFHHINDNIMLNAGAAWGNASDVAYRLGITWSW